MPHRTLRRTVTTAALVFIGAALLILSGLLPGTVRDVVYLLLPATWLTVCCGLASLALSRTRRAG
ncbi:hypothetical protein GCM10010168_42590 [Actinoplanes ianthinogenes]|uniref:Uncharacterized protein n=1 Tax=Actinoplanes ianthinogenes TaxID=122358 RepID=A0ABM7LW50_9ACTN|nr:hypothetical protein [Actinoplanes ianthinogenes]BCJ43431.1 hypothetical protein Aiant_40880 [Actinoplanes ianthinogenes]GGR20165.1 hypothetical protein GCM10010168_42590 [Actinoplanes ianthinogenes]